MPTYSSSAHQALQALGLRLREIRVDARITGRRLSASAGWHESKVSKIEHGKQPPSVADIRTWCQLCGAESLAPELIASLRAVETMFTEWRRMERSGLKQAQQAVLPLWDRTKRFRAYNSWIVPGILQTRAYTRAALESLAQFRDIPGEVDEAVDVRMQKQSVLHRGDHRFAILLEENVLRHRLGSADVLFDQLRHLEVVAALPSVSLGVIPFHVNRHRWPAEGFWVFDDDRVNVELISGWLTITQPHEVALYVKTFTELAALAVYGADVRALLNDAMQAL